MGVRQHTQDVCGCLWLSVSTQRASVAVRVCQCVSVCTHRTSMGVRQHTQDIRGCMCMSVCVHQHTQDVCGCPSVHISARWPFPWTVRVILAHVGCLLSTHRTSVGFCQHTHDIRVCRSAHTGRPCVSVSTHRTFVAVRVCPGVSVSTHMTSVAVHQYTYQHVGPLTPHADPSCGLFG